MTPLRCSPLPRPSVYLVEGLVIMSSPLFHRLKYPILRENKLDGASRPIYSTREFHANVSEGDLGAKFVWFGSTECMQSSERLERGYTIPCIRIIKTTQSSNTCLYCQNFYVVLVCKLRDTVGICLTTKSLKEVRIST